MLHTEQVYRYISGVQGQKEEEQEGVNHMSHGKVTEQDEVVNGKEKRVGAAVAAEDEEGEEGEGVDGVVLAACGDGKETVAQKDVAIGMEGHELTEGTVDVVDETQTAAAVGY